MASAGFAPKREADGAAGSAGFAPKRPVAGLIDSAGFAPNRADPSAAGVADEEAFSAGFDPNIAPVEGAGAGAAPPKRGLFAVVPAPAPPNKPGVPVAGCEGGGPAGVVENDSGDGLLVLGVVDPLFNAPPNRPPLEGG